LAHLLLTISERGAFAFRSLTSNSADAALSLPRWLAGWS
jgi:hypothetical protein